MGGQIMKYIKYLLLLSFLVAADADDMIVIKNGNVFVDGEGFVKKDILVDEGKILLVEDDKSLQQLIVYNFKKEGFKINTISNGDEALYLILENQPDLILLDWMLPNTSGIEIIRQLKINKNTMSIPVIMLTAKSEEPDKLRAFEIGADDYITKPFSTAELLARTKALLKRTKLQQDNQIINFQDISLNKEKRRVNRGKRTVKLGPMEYKLLELFISRPGRVYERSQLLDIVWGKDIYVEERTVDVHIGRLRKALNRSKDVDPIRTVHGTGYSLDETYKKK